MTPEQTKIIKAFTEGDAMFVKVLRAILILAFVLTMIWLTPLDVFGEDDPSTDEQHAQDLTPPSIVPGGVTINNYTDNNGILHQCTYICNPVGKTRVCNTVCL